METKNVSQNPGGRARGRATSIFLQRTIPKLQGLWLNQTTSFEGLRRHMWTIENGEVSWFPKKPADADLKINSLIELQRIHECNAQRNGQEYFRLSGTTKTGKTWSLPAVESCPRIDQTCVGCYALDGWYRTNLLGQYARVRRFEKIRELIDSNKIDDWVNWMVSTLQRIRPVEVIPEKYQAELSPWYTDIGIDRRTPVPFFRWHDSGDLFNRIYTRAVVQVANLTPNLLHWLPTRVPEMLLHVVQDGQTLPNNLSVLVSRVHNGQNNRHSQIVGKVLDLQPNARIGWSETFRGPSSRTIITEDFRTAYPQGADLCPATVAQHSGDRHCGGCRRCWAYTSLDRPVVYAFHKGN